MRTSEGSFQKVAARLEETTRRINALVDVDVHWYRRVFHAFAASFLVYYLVPDVLWMSVVKVAVLLGVLSVIAFLEYLRIKGRIESTTFFGLRLYEQERAGSYLYFGVAVVPLLLFFPQQIAIPCILCASLADPLMGEFRYRFGDRYAVILGFFVCLLFFSLVWRTGDPLVMTGVSVVGAALAVGGEARKFRWVDDDFMIQMLPAVLLSLLWFGLKTQGVDILPAVVLHPL